MDSPFLFGVGITLFFSFFFTCFEVGYLMADKTQIAREGTEGGLSSKILAYFIQRPSFLVGTTRVGYCTALVFFNYFTTHLLLPIVTEMFPTVFDQSLVTAFIQIIFSTLLILLTAQFLPKVLGNFYPNKMLLSTAILFGISFVVLFPLTRLILTISRLVMVRMFHHQYDESHPLFGITNLNQYFKNIYNVNQENVDLELDKKILHNALEFKTVKIRECMIPRNEISAIDIQEGIEKLQQVFVESGHSKIIIYRNSLDDIIGYCHSSFLFTMPEKIEDILTSVITVPESSMASDLMRRFITEKKSLAVVMDEFGGTSGIVSREDVIEEIFGDIEDEYDEDNLMEQKLDEFNYLLSARLEIDYLNEKYKWQLPIGEYETLGGLILAYAEDLPNPGETVTIAPYTFSIQATHNNRIDTIKITLEPATQEL